MSSETWQPCVSHIRFYWAREVTDAYVPCSNDFTLIMTPSQKTYYVVVHANCLRGCLYYGTLVTRPTTRTTASEISQQDRPSLSTLGASAKEKTKHLSPGTASHLNLKYQACATCAQILSNFWCCRGADIVHGTALLKKEISAEPPQAACSGWPHSL